MKTFWNNLQKTGKLLKKGEPDIETAAKMVLYDWLRGKIPYFTPPPDHDIMDEATIDTRIKLPSQKISSIRTRQDFYTEDELQSQVVFGEDDMSDGEEWADMEDLNWDDVAEEKMEDTETIENEETEKTEKQLPI